FIIADDGACDPERKFGGVHDLFRVNPGQWASGDVAGDVAAGSLWREADFVQRVDDFRKRLNGEPVQLDVLSRGDVAHVARVLLHQLANDAHLRRLQQAVGRADAHHEVFGHEAFAALAADGADAVALGVGSPPAEVGADPFGSNAIASFARELAHFVECLPGVLFALDALEALGLGFFYRCGWGIGHVSSEKALRVLRSNVLLEIKNPPKRGGSRRLRLNRDQQQVRLMAEQQHAAVRYIRITYYDTCRQSGGQAFSFVAAEDCLRHRPNAKKETFPCVFRFR